LWGEVAFPDHAGWSELLISLADSCVNLQLQLFGQLFSQWGGAFQFWLLPYGLGDQLCNPLPALFGGGLSLCLFTGISELGVLFLCPIPISRAGSAFHPPWTDTSAVVCFSVLQGSLILDASLWLRRWSLWSTTFPASGSGLSPTCCQSLLPFLCLFTDSLALRPAPWPSPFLWCTFRVPPTLSTVHTNYSSQFVIQFCWEGISLPRVCAVFCSPGVDRGVLHGSWYLPVCLSIDA
jgi:hypothetical protein